MILLDTNVVSELMRPRIDPSVAAYIERTPRETMFVPSLVVAELRYGVGRLPPGRRRDGLAQGIETFLATGFVGRVLDFDAACAAGYATARIAREKLGRSVAVIDALIGGMALAHGATLATRNTVDFEGYGLSLIDPWIAS